MVRLKGSRFSQARTHCPRFQFQNGAIKSIFVKPYKFRPKKFQFQNGAIKSNQLHKRDKIILCFNSKMVRLKGFQNSNFNHVTLEFQFQNGAIKSLTMLPLVGHFDRFQFQNGAIKSNTT